MTDARQRRLYGFEAIAIAVGAMGDEDARRMIEARLGDQPAALAAVRQVWTGAHDRALLDTVGGGPRVMLEAGLDIIADPEQVPELLPKAFREHLRDGTPFSGGLSLTDAIFQLPPDDQRTSSRGSTTSTRAPRRRTRPCSPSWSR